jgi:hypothetical protein
VEAKNNQFNQLEENKILIPKEQKVLGKEYGFVSLTNDQVYLLTECIDLLSVSPTISLKFSKKIEDYLLPRFFEINKILSKNPSLPDEIMIEFSKENHKELINSIDAPNVANRLAEAGLELNDFKTILKKVKFIKYK